MISKGFPGLNDKIPIVTNIKTYQLFSQRYIEKYSGAVLLLLLPYHSSYTLTKANMCVCMSMRVCPRICVSMCVLCTHEVAVS